MFLSLSCPSLALFFSIRSSKLKHGLFGVIPLCLKIDFAAPSFLLRHAGFRLQVFCRCSPSSTLRYGCLPAVVPPPPLKSWLRQHRKASSSLIFSEMKSIRYTPDCGTCNYLFPTLSKIGQFGEAVDVLKGMGRAGCVPDCDSYGGLIAELSEARKVDAVAGW
ncbi:hypothetical protein SASPL_141683 [Salvia splendens]|uniref:Pentatricopeptide repeat-containing protein n=1 Tax=Salvia splendens TaxID=180675 RepID=A0A8X8Z931_SALSN|nr:hypothetical protein SASPL_141683 [Salvia splendens]